MSESKSDSKSESESDYTLPQFISLERTERASVDIRALRPVAFKRNAGGSWHSWKHYEKMRSDGVYAIRFIDVERNSLIFDVINGWQRDRESV